MLLVYFVSSWSVASLFPGVFFLNFMFILFINEITLRHIIVKSGLIEELSSFDAFLIAIGDANSDS